MSQQGREEIAMNEFIPPKLYHVRIVRVGLVHLIVGFITIAIGVMDVSFSSVAFGIFPLARVCSGIWTGAVIVATGITGALQSKSELRKKAVSIAFAVFSVLSWLLSIVLIGIAVGEIAESEFAEGELITREKLTNNGTDCSNLTKAANLNITCVATATFDQKLVTDILLIVFGYIEGFAAFYSVVVSIDIAKKQSSSRDKEGMRMRERVNIPDTRANPHFQEHPESKQNPGETAHTSNGNVSESQENVQVHEEDQKTDDPPLPNSDSQNPE